MHSPNNLNQKKQQHHLLRTEITHKIRHQNQVKSNYQTFSHSYSFPFSVVKENVLNTVYVGQLPENANESDIKKLFPKSTKIELFPSKTTPKGIRAAFAFVTFADDNAAANAVKVGPTLKLKNTQLKVAYQTKRAN